MVPSKLSVVTALLAILFFCSLVFADSAQEMLESAKKKHKEDVTAAKETLSKAIMTCIKESAQKEDLAGLKALISQKEAFDSSGTLPTDPRLSEDVNRYIGSRRTSASTMYFAYQKSIQAYAALKLLDNAKSLEAESKHFVDDELAVISLNKSPKTDAISATAKKTDIEQNHPSMRDELIDFFSEYRRMMREIDNESTTVRKQDVHRNLAAKIDEQIKNQTWEFHCRIVDIKANNKLDLHQAGSIDREFTISHSPPKELPDPGPGWSFRINRVVLPLPQQQALDLNLGDTIIYTGTPRFTTQPHSVSAKFEAFRYPTDSGNMEYFVRGVKIADEYAVHALHLENVKVEFQKSSDTNDSGKKD